MTQPQRLDAGPVAFLSPAGWAPPHSGATQLQLFSPACPGGRIEVQYGSADAHSHLSGTQVASAVIMHEAYALTGPQWLAPYAVPAAQGEAAAAVARGEVNGGPARIAALVLLGCAAWASVIIAGPEDEATWSALSAAGDGIAASLEINRVRIAPQTPFFLSALTAFPPPQSQRSIGHIDIGGVVLKLPSGWVQVPENDPDWDMYSAPPTGGYGPATLIVGKVAKSGPVWQMADQVIRNIAAYHRMPTLLPPQQGNVASFPAVRIATQGHGTFGMGAVVDVGDVAVVIFIAAMSDFHVVEMDRIVADAVPSAVYAAQSGRLSSPTSAGIGNAATETLHADEGWYRISGVAFVPFKALAAKVSPKTQGGAVTLDLGANAAVRDGRAQDVAVTVYRPNALPGVTATDMALAQAMASYHEHQLRARYPHLVRDGGVKALSLVGGVACQRALESSTGLPPARAGVTAIAEGSSCVVVSWTSDTADDRVGSQAGWLANQIRVGARASG